MIISKAKYLLCPNVNASSYLDGYLSLY